jgi:hypothetical protein
MKIFSSVFVILMLILVSCKNKQEKELEIDTTEVIKETNIISNEVAQPEIGKSDKEGLSINTTFVLKSSSDWRTEEYPDSKTYYSTKKEPVVFYSRGKYGVLEYDREDDLAKDYYIFNTSENLEQELTIDLKDALFSMTEAQLKMDMSGYYIIMDNYLFLNEPVDNQMGMVIIDMEKQTVVGDFGCTEKGITSYDGEFITFWEYSSIKADKDTICPELKEQQHYEYYVITEEMKHALKTNETTKTGNLGCDFMQ